MEDSCLVFGPHKTHPTQNHVTIEFFVINSCF